MASERDPAEACPVDHKTREAWLEQARKSQSPIPNPHASIPTAPSLPSQTQEGCDSSKLDQSPSPSTGVASKIGLATQREVSTIPRVSQNAPGERPANNESETGADKKTGNWIYPSEEMFFNAMKRKSYNPNETDMRTIVPIHNAVNERAWKEIKDWEKGRGADACGGPRLESFSGLSKALTPRARFNALLGYQTPFDRHDWVIDRCGTKVEYVIDFYAGKDEKKQGKSLNFYLDVRPKLNSWEGIKTRALHSIGL
ncbi:cytochrome c1 heme lyase [Aaosphaeria arxii CBS 175.79]|uniref:Holocytochrome c-type synthase n=1 Tax=Aaosphaeria arxii CBS 175.79 TaxID=1450172 RepID=A0A6A5XMX8_9PLEO|nr:cytochrome c1 heme lyase [Aaosphaeria arxii CBS 175.79]KAF2013694.1 cytochrome c1 heme lyase [Aaosphaeria arxii CBS 175.79]